MNHQLLQRIEDKVDTGERITMEEGLFLDEQADLLYLGRLAALCTQLKDRT